MNVPQVFTKIISTNNIKEGTVTCGCNVPGIIDKESLRSIINHEDPIVIGNKYKDKYQDWDHYGN